MLNRLNPLPDAAATMFCFSQQRSQSCSRLNKKMQLKFCGAKISEEEVLQALLNEVPVSPNLALQQFI